MSGKRKKRFCSRLRYWAAGLGLNEVVNYFCVGQKTWIIFLFPPRDALPNPLSADQDVLRTMLAPGMLQTLRNNNLAQGARRSADFELANVFEANAAAETGCLKKGVLGLLLTACAMT